MRRLLYMLIAFLLPLAMQAQGVEIDIDGGRIDAEFRVSTTSPTQPVLELDSITIEIVDDYSWLPPYIVFPNLEIYGSSYSGYTVSGARYIHTFIVSIDCYMNFSYYTSNSLNIYSYQGSGWVNMYQRSQEIDPGVLSYSGSNPIAAGAPIGVLTGTDAVTYNNLDVPLEEDPLCEIEYMWQKKEAGTQWWLDIPNSGSKSYNPGGVSKTTYFRRGAKDGYTWWSYTNEITITVASTFTRSTNKNYISTYLPEYKTTTTNFKMDSTVSATVYYDGLGREEQRIDYMASPDKRNIISFTQYDNMGRNDFRTFLPYINFNPNSLYISTPSLEQKAYYQEKFYKYDDKNYSFAEKQYEATPTGLLKKQGGLGLSRSLHATKGHPIEYDYYVDERYNVIRKLIMAPNDIDIQTSGYYALNRIVVKKDK